MVVVGEPFRFDERRPASDVAASRRVGAPVAWFAGGVGFDGRTVRSVGGLLGSQPGLVGVIRGDRTGRWRVDVGAGASVPRVGRARCGRGSTVCRFGFRSSSDGGCGQRPVPVGWPFGVGGGWASVGAGVRVGAVGSRSGPGPVGVGGGADGCRRGSGARRCGWRRVGCWVGCRAR